MLILLLNFFNMMLESVVRTDFFQIFLGIQAVFCILGWVYNKLS